MNKSPLIHLLIQLFNSSCGQLEKFQKTNSKFQFKCVFHDISLEFGAWNLELAQVRGYPQLELFTHLLILKY